MSDAASLPADSAPPPSPPIAAPVVIPWLGLTAVLLGTFISTLNGRLSTFGLADIRGAVHAGFDDGAWITTASTVAQMFIAPIAIWIGGVYGPRRVLLDAAAAFTVISFLTPFSNGLPMLLALQFVGGLASGTFIPLTLGFLLRNLPPKYWAYGVAIYALNLELSLNISASLEGWYVEHLSWVWIFWQNVPLAAGMVLCLHFGVPRDPPNPNAPRADIFGLIAGGLGLALIYGALDQGNRLDWLNSGLVWGLLLAGAVLVAGFVVHEMRTVQPGVNLKVVFAAPLPRLLLLIAFLRLTILSTAFLIPQYLQVVRGFRALQVGNTLIWIAAPQLILCPLAGLMLRRTDPRLVSSIGFIFISLACLMVAHGLTPVWSSDQFLPSQFLQAIGQSFALSGIIFFGVLHLKPQDALTFGAALQIARLMGGEIGTAFVATLVRVRTQTASNLIGLHVQTGDGQVVQRLQALAGVAGRSDTGLGAARAAGLLAGQVRTAASLQGIIDTFVVVGGLTALALLIVVAHKPAPLGPASHRPLFASPDATSMTNSRLPCWRGLALLAGCAVGPNYQAPTPPAGAEAPLVSLKPEAESAAQPPDDWWRLYQDPLLDKYLAEAFAANEDLKAAEANLNASRAVLQAWGAGNYPATPVAADAIYGRDPNTDEILEIVGAKPQTTWIDDTLIDVSYEFDLFGRVRRQVEAARADAAAAEAGRDVFRITVAAETTRAYAQICTLGEQLAVARHSLDVVSREAWITGQRHAAGANSEFDVVRAQALVAQARSVIPPLEGQRRAALFQLAALLGRTPAHAPAEAEACVTPPHLDALIPIGDGAALLRRRPDVRLADRRVAAAIARIGVASADLYPRISLTGLYGGAAADTADLTRNAGLTWGVGPSISWSFPNQLGPRARVRQARAGEAAALASFDSVVLQALKETEQSLATYSSELDRREALADAQDKARKAFDIAHGQFLAGSIPNLDLLTTEQVLVASDAAVAASDAALAQDQIAVFKALGGGWRSAAAGPGRP